MRVQLPWDVPPESFVAAVRSGAISSPAQRAFSEEKWKSAFEKIQEPSLADTRLFLSGSYFNLRFREVREALAQDPRSRITISERIQLLVGYANYLVLSAEKGIKPVSDSNDSVAREARAEAFHQFARWGEHHVASMIDGLRYPLAQQWRSDADVTAPQLTEEQQVTAVARAARLGRLYDALEDTWNHCLWRGWYFTYHDDHPVIVSPDMNVEDQKAVGDFRYSQLSLEFGLVIRQAWDLAGTPEKQAILSRPRVIGIKKDGKRKKHLVLGTGLMQGEPTTADFNQMRALDSYSESLVERESAALGGMTVSHLLSAWYALTPLANLLFQHPNLPEEVDRPSILRHLSPLLPVAELQRVLVAVLGISPAQSATIVNLFTFKDEHRIDPWTRPFIAVNDTEVAILRPVLAATNLNRLATRWIRDAGFSLDERGPLWEEEIRRSASGGNRLPNAQVYPNSFEFRSTSGVEEIDFLARIGNTILVGEAKCSLIPTNSHDYARFISLLADAADQAGRKADRIRQEAASFLKQIEWDVEEPLTILPFVITNQPQGVGYEFGDVPVVDQLILDRFFNEGELQQGVLRAGSEVVSAAKTVRFYTTPAEAEASVASYLRNPPQLAVPRAKLTTEAVPLPPVADQSLGCHVLVRKISIPPVWVGGDQPDWMMPGEDSAASLFSQPVTPP